MISWKCDLVETQEDFCPLDPESGLKLIVLFRVYGEECRVQDLGLHCSQSSFGVEGAIFWDAGLRVEVSDLKVQGLRV